LLLNIITGAIAEMNDFCVEVDESTDTVIKFDKNCTTVDIKKSHKNKNMTLYYMVNQDNYFKSNFARVKPFLYSKARFMMSSYILPYNNFVVKCNVDSILSTKPIDYKVGNKFGDLAIEYLDKDILVKSNAKEIFLEI